LLDDSIEFRHKLTTLNVPARLNVLEGLHHGFLNFILANKSSHRGFQFVTKLLKATVSSTTTTDGCDGTKSESQLADEFDVKLVTDHLEEEYPSSQKLKFDKKIKKGYKRSSQKIQQSHERKSRSLEKKRSL
jgi:hypothetical protein